MKRHLNLSNVHGLGRLTLDAARLITDVVEDAHATVLGGVRRPFLASPNSSLGAFLHR